MVKPLFHIGLTPDAKTIREEVFMKEQGFLHEFDEDDATAVHLVLYLDQTPIATGRLVKIDPATYQIGRVAVLPAYRHQRVGSYLMEFLCTKARELGAKTAVVHAQLDKQSFYRRLGFVDYGEGLIDEDEGVPHIYLAKTLFVPHRRVYRK